MTAPKDFVCKSCGRRTSELAYDRINADILACAKLDIPLGRSTWEMICCEEERAALRKRHGHTAEVSVEPRSPRLSPPKTPE
jgi:hypothetical protein